jgi:hypothetical protein
MLMDNITNYMQNNIKTKNRTKGAVFGTTFSVITAISLSLALLSLNSNPSTMGQGGNATITPPTQATDTFSANGVITGVLTEGEEITTGGGNTEGNQTTQQLPWIVGGDWRLNVDKGNVTDFMSNFTMVKADGTMHHGHAISNLTTKSGGIRLDVNGNATMNGTSIIKVNGTDTWTGVDTGVGLNNFVILAISPNPQQVENHFGNLPITGIVTSLTTQNGTEVLTTGEKVVKQQQQASQGNQSQSQGNQTGNQTQQQKGGNQSQQQNQSGGGPLSDIPIIGGPLEQINPFG